MSKTLPEIAQQLIDANKKVQLIYAFNGTGKTRLSRELKKLICPKFDEIESLDNQEDFDAIGETRKKFLYYNAFTEDLFYWDNDLKGDSDPKLKIQPNSFTTWVLKDQGQDQNIITNFQSYANDKLTPSFNEEYKTKDRDDPTKEITVPAFSEVTFSLQRGDDTQSGNIKISKGEESNFIWSIFYALLCQVTNILNVAEIADRETDQFNNLEYVFIDDPVSSLDENHLIELAINLAELIKSSTSDLKFIITTHNPLFYNVLYSELGVKNGYILNRFEDSTFDLEEKKGDSNTSFSYHLHLKKTLEKAINDNQIEKYHFTLLRNLYEKTSSFLGHPRWSELLPDDKQTYYNRVIQFTSHSNLSNEAVAEPSPQEKQIVKFLLDHLCNNYNYWIKREENNAGTK